MRKPWVSGRLRVDRAWADAGAHAGPRTTDAHAAGAFMLARSSEPGNRSGPLPQEPIAR